jgi:hypothetical protein
MSEHVFLYRIKNSDDRDCCAYIDANGSEFVCNHYFSGLNICGSCYIGRDWAAYDDIETILTKVEYEQLLRYNDEIHELGYGITKGDSRYQKGIKIINKIEPIIDKLKSDEAQEFFDRISSEEMEVLKEEYRLNDSDIECILDEYPLDYRDRSIVTAVYSDMDDLGREEAWQYGYINRENESLMDRYFDYEKFGEDVVSEDEFFIEITHNRAVRISL